MISAFAFFTVFMYNSIGSLLVSNLIYYILLLKSIIKDGVLSIRKNKSIKLWLFLFISWATISTFIFTLEQGTIEFRNIVQYIFTLQYIIFIINLEINWSKFELWLYRFAILLSLVIIILYISTGEIKNISNLFTTGRIWAKNYIPGWPNTTPIPLLFGLFLGIKKDKPLLHKTIFITALLLTTSRGALLGITLIFSYFLYIKFNKKKFQYIIILIPAFTMLVLFADNFIQILYSVIPSLEYRIGVSYDRQDIFYITLLYLKNKPLLGYGGNTIDQIIPIYGNMSLYGKDWGHAHNWILETLIRYGSIGLFFFIGFITALLKDIKSYDNKFMFGLILFLGLFQTFLRNFCVLILMVYLLDNSRNQHSNN